MGATDPKKKKKKKSAQGNIHSPRISAPGKHRQTHLHHGSDASPTPRPSKSDYFFSGMDLIYSAIKSNPRMAN